jgi:hypothetical protein
MGGRYLPAKIITLTTDFGLRDPYVAEMKATILGIYPTATIVDITHEVEKFNVRTGAFILASTANYFPEGTIHVAVVDPGVGTSRRSVIIQTKRDIYVGPDNGLLMLAAKKQEIVRTAQIANPKFMLPKISDTFHGRDIFAPAAAHLATGVPLAEFGPIICDIAEPDFAKINTDGSAVIGEVLHIDGFGNIITNIGDPEIRSANLEKEISVEIGNQRLKLRISKNYGENKIHELLALVGSQGYLEIAVNQGNAAKMLGVRPGDKLRIERKTRHKSDSRAIQWRDPRA